MLSTVEIKNVKFSKAIGGYKQEEVDDFLDKVADDYVMFERQIRDYEIKTENFEQELVTLKESQASIQSVLLNAQNLADRIVNEAKEKSEEIIRKAEKEIAVMTDRERELSAAFELKAAERKKALEKELSDMVKAAQLKADGITSVANESVARQQMLFDKLKLEIASFKSSITAKYKEHIELLSRIPETIPNDPEYLAQLVVADFNKPAEIEQVITKPVIEEAKAEETNSLKPVIEEAKVEETNSPKPEMEVEKIEDISSVTTENKREIIESEPLEFEVDEVEKVRPMVVNNDEDENFSGGFQIEVKV